MHFLLLYSIKLSCSLAVLWLFYRLVLRNLTFYDLNRWYLLGYSILSFLIPLIDIGPALEQNMDGESLIMQFIPPLGQYVPAVAPAPMNQAIGWSAWDSIAGVLLLGMGILLIRTFLRWLSLRQLRQKASLIMDGAVRIYQVDETIAPFSFGRAIFINRGLHTEKEWEEIILHEYVHIRQRHTVDIVLAEWLTIFNWYDPFAWLIRHSIRQNLEFIADRKVLDNGFDKKDYQYHLLKVVGQPQYRLVNNFNFSSLKKRIVMMNKLRSARLHLVKFLFILPLLALSLVAFRNGYTGFSHRSDGPVYVNAVGIVLGFPGESPLAGVAVRERETGLQTTTDANGFYKLRIPVIGDSLRIHLNFTRDGYKDDFRERYIPSLKESIGVIDIGTLFSETQAYHGVFIGFPPPHRFPTDPTYADAVAALKECVQANEDAQRHLAMEKAHPEVALFYTTEDKLKQLVIHTDGTIERYGYPGGPAVEEMEKKYGQLPQWSRPGGNTAGSGYLAHWASISAQAEKEFHTTNPAARAIIFPGDSRVIAVDASGKARFYDMDNDDPSERPAFEKQFGRLPDCVPAGYHYPAMPRHDPRKDTFPPQHLDTLRVMQKGTEQHGVLHFSSWPLQPPPLIVIDGVETDTARLSQLNPNRIESINVLKDSAAVAKYGSRGKNGVILIQLKKTEPVKP